MTPQADIDKDTLFNYILRVADDRLILGHRLSEWCGHDPILEEDIALANMALDLIGQTEALLKLAAQVESKSRSEDDLAFLRGEREFRNCTLVEQPNGDFACTMVRQFLFDSFAVEFLDSLSNSSFEELAAIAKKSLKEAKYHWRHSSSWVVRLGDGTEESKERTQNALDMLWRYTGELFEVDELQQKAEESALAPKLAELRAKWNTRVEAVLAQATLSIPDNEQYMATGSRSGRHSEHLGHLLAEMQILPRSFPGANW